MRSLLGAESSAGDEGAPPAARIVRLRDVAGEAQRRAHGTHAAQGPAPGSWRKKVSVRDKGSERPFSAWVMGAAWLAELLAFGLVRGSFVPPEPL
jgi:hypothetical protein